MIDRVALVTGASRGVGQGIAVALGEEGGTVYVTGHGPGTPGSPLARYGRPGPLRGR